MSAFRPKLPLDRHATLEDLGVFVRDVIRHLKELSDQVLVPFTRSKDGLVPSPGPNTPATYTLKADGTWGP